ncbi:unnamed protein product, partial [Mycena citricolor]
TAPDQLPSVICKVFCALILCITPTVIDYSIALYSRGHSVVSIESEKYTDRPQSD